VVVALALAWHQTLSDKGINGALTSCPPCADPASRYAFGIPGPARPSMAHRRGMHAACLAAACRRAAGRRRQAAGNAAHPLRVGRRRTTEWMMMSEGPGGAGRGGAAERATSRGVVAGQRQDGHQHQAGPPVRHRPLH
jgi:hypothetical protein